MMKRIFSLLFVAVACSVAALAQTSLVATLKHGSTISEYYGVSALAEAYAAAATGDVITLSGGEFTAVDIEKAITVRGAGVPLANEYPTILVGAFTITIPIETSWLTLEGVQCLNDVTVFSTNEQGKDKLPSANILKCYFTRYVYCANSNPNFIHCVFANGPSSIRDFNGGRYNTTVTCRECVVCMPAAQSEVGGYLATLNMENCLVLSTNFRGGSLYHSSFVNCIIYGYSGLSSFDSNHNISYSLCVGEGMEGVTKTTNMFLPNVELSTIFKNFLNPYTLTPHTSFELTDEAQSLYKGFDGTQVGIYGGSMPYDPTPTNPQIKKFGVSTSNIDGKLNVKINVE